MTLVYVLRLATTPQCHHHVLEFGPVEDPKQASRDAGEQQKVLSSIYRQH